MTISKFTNFITLGTLTKDQYTVIGDTNAQSSQGTSDSSTITLLCITHEVIKQTVQSVMPFKTHRVY